MSGSERPDPAEEAAEPASPHLRRASLVLDLRVRDAGRVDVAARGDVVCANESTHFERAVPVVDLDLSLALDSKDTVGHHLDDANRDLTDELVATTDLVRRRLRAIVTPAGGERLDGQSHERSQVRATLEGGRALGSV